MPSASGVDMARILRLGQASGLRCKTVPGLADVIENLHLSSQIRDVAVEDLLGRSQVRLEQEAITAKLCGTTVLVSGAAGSIGSELCRQIARFEPAAIIAYDVAETPLFHLENEMRKAFPDVTFIPEIGSIQNRARLNDVFLRHRPAAVFHAAAYKHVPMMELHPFEALENNLLGTFNLASAAKQHGVADFVMISSDKAVRPTSIMGATKRLAELLINDVQKGDTKFVAVRFGNVLGSNGSVVPIFKAQIAAGGPVTVTHPDMCRYFMTIPEACQLVLQASTMGRGGEIFVLDMGQPVKIVDLATNLILLSGLRPDHDVKIEFTGLRPGEKLYEELSAYNEHTLPTHHEKIKIFAGNGVPQEGMTPHLDRLAQTCRTRDARALLFHFKELIPDYNPSTQILEAALGPAAAGPPTQSLSATA
jgi:FlaA1/EpsC-like NDP-sugar epimerase